MTFVAKNVSSVLIRCMILVLPLEASFAAEWDYGVDIEVGIIRSDNVFLDAPGGEQPDTVYLVAPTFYANTDEDRIVADIRYRPSAVFFSKYSDSDGVYHQLDASMTGAIVKGRLFVYMQAANFQTIVDPEGRIPLDNLTISPNRTDAAVYEIRPFYKQPVGTAEFYIEAGYLNVEYDEDRIQSSEEKYAFTSLGNLTRQEGVAWQVDYRYRLTEYDQPPEWEFQRAAMSLGYWFKGRLRIFGVGGVETSFDNFLEPNLDADFWEAGFQYSPGNRLNLELAVGERSYGDSFRGDFFYKMKRGEISASYSETPTSRAEILYNRRPLEDNQAPDFVLDSPNLSDRFVLKRGDVTLNIELSRSTLTFNAFTESRENVSTVEGEELEDEYLAGGSAGWKWRMGARTTLSATGYFVSREAQRTLATTEPVLYDDELTRGILGVAYDLTSWLNMRVEYVRTNQDGATPGEGYDETQYRLIFTGKL